MTMLDVLWATRRQLDDPKHWWKGGAKRSDQTCVALGLMDNAQRFCSLKQRHADYLAAGTAVALSAGLVQVPLASLAVAIGRWNDDPCTTHADVLAALDKAIDAEKSREAA